MQKQGATDAKMNQIDLSVSHPGQNQTGQQQPSRKSVQSAGVTGQKHSKSKGKTTKEQQSESQYHTSSKSKSKAKAKNEPQSSQRHHQNLLSPFSDISSKGRSSIQPIGSGKAYASPQTSSLGYPSNTPQASSKSAQGSKQKMVGSTGLSKHSQGQKQTRVKQYNQHGMAGKQTEKILSVPKDSGNSRTTKQQPRVHSSPNSQNQGLRSPGGSDANHFDLPLGSEIQQQMNERENVLNQNNMVVSPQRPQNLTPLMQQSSEKFIPKLNPGNEFDDHLYENGANNYGDGVADDSNEQMDCSIDIFQNQESLDLPADRNLMYQNSNQNIQGRASMGGFGGPGRPVPNDNSQRASYLPAVFSKELLLKCQQNNQIGEYLQDSSPYLKSLIQSKLNESNHMSPNVSPIAKIKSPSGSANTSMAIHPLMIQVSDTETNYAQQYIKNNYGYDIQEIYQIEQDMLKNSKEQRKKNELETLDVITELDPLSTVRNPHFDEKSSFEIIENPEIRAEPASQKVTPIHQNTQNQKLADQNEQIEKQETVGVAENSVQFTDNERSEINYEEIRVTDSFSVVGNMEATRNSNLSSLHMTSRNTVNHRGSRFMVEIQSVESEGRGWGKPAEGQRSEHSESSSQQQKDINDIEIANTMVQNTQGGTGSKQQNNKITSSKSKKQNEQISTAKQSPAAMAGPTFEFNKLRLQTSSSLIGSNSDMIQAKSKFMTKANTPMQCSNNTSPKNGLPLMVTPKTIKQTAADKSTNQLADQYSAGQRPENIIYEISHNTSKISLSEEVGGAQVTDAAGLAGDNKTKNYNNQALPNQIIINQRQQQRSQTNYQQQNQPRLLEQQIHTSGEQCFQRYDTQEDLQTKFNNQKEEAAGQGRADPQGVADGKNTRFMATMFTPSCQIFNNGNQMGSANVYGQDNLAGGYQPSEVESSVVQFNALSFNNLGMQFQTSHPRSRAISGEKFNEMNLSVRQSLLAERIEQMRGARDTIEEEAFFQSKLSLMEAAQKEQLYQQIQGQSQKVKKEEELKQNLVRSLQADNHIQQYQSTDRQLESKIKNSVQMSPSQEMSSLNVDEITPQLSPNSTNSNYFSKNRSQIVNKSFSKKSPALSKLKNKQINQKTVKNTVKSPKSSQKGQQNVSNAKNRVESPQKLAQSKSNRSIQLPTSSQISLKKPMVLTKNVSKKDAPQGQTAIHKSHQLSPPAISLSRSRMKSHEKQFQGLETGFMSNEKHMNCSMTMTVGGGGTMTNENMSPFHVYREPVPNDCDDDKYIPTMEPELTQFQSNVSSLIQLPNKTGQIAKLSEKNSVPRSLSSVQNKHASIRLRAILQSTYADNPVLQLTQRESKSHRRNNNPLSMDANSAHGQTHQVILDQSNHIKPVKKEELIRFIESPTPPQSTFFINSTSNTPIRGQSGPGIKGVGVGGGIGVGFNDTGAKSMHLQPQSYNCKISDLLGRDMDHEMKEKTLQQIILESECNFEQNQQLHQQQQQQFGGYQFASKSAEIPQNFVAPCQDSNSGQNMSKNSLITHSPQSFQSPPVKQEDRSIRYSLISLFKGTDKINQGANNKKSDISIPSSLQMTPNQGNPLVSNQILGEYRQNQGHDLKDLQNSKGIRQQAKSQEMVKGSINGVENKHSESRKNDSGSSFFKQLSNFKKNFLEFSTPSKSQEHHKTVKHGGIFAANMSNTVILDQSTPTVVTLHNQKNSKSAPKNSWINNGFSKDAGNFKVESHMQKYLNQTQSHLNSVNKVNLQMDGNDMKQQFTPVKGGQINVSNASRIPHSSSIKSIQHKASSVVNMRSNRSSVSKPKKSTNAYIPSKFGPTINNLTLNEQDLNSEKLGTDLKFSYKVEAVSATSTPHEKKSAKQVGTLSESNTEKLSLSSPKQQNYNCQQNNFGQISLAPSLQDNLNFYLSLGKKNDGKIQNVIEQSSRSRHTQFQSQGHKQGLMVNNSQHVDSTRKIYTENGSRVKTPYQLKETQELLQEQTKIATDKIDNYVTMDSQIIQQEISLKDSSQQQDPTGHSQASPKHPSGQPSYPISFFMNSNVSFQKKPVNETATNIPEDLQTPKWKQGAVKQSGTNFNLVQNNNSTAFSLQSSRQQVAKSVIGPSSQLPNSFSITSPKGSAQVKSRALQNYGSQSAANKMQQTKVFNSKFASVSSASPTKPQKSQNSQANSAAKSKSGGKNIGKVVAGGVGKRK